MPLSVKSIVVGIDTVKKSMISLLKYHHQGGQSCWLVVMQATGMRFL